MAVMEAADAAAEEKAFHIRIVKKRQRMNKCAIAREQNHAVREMARLPPKEEKEDDDGDDNSDGE